MPEISFCLFDMKYLFKLFPKKNEELNDNLKDFENKFEGEMAENRAEEGAGSENRLYLGGKLSVYSTDFMSIIIMRT